MHCKQIESSGYLLLEYMLCLFCSVLFGMLISALFFQVQKTVVMIKNNITEQQEISFFYHYFLGVISMSGINGLEFSPQLLSVQSRWTADLGRQQPKNLVDGDILNIKGTSSLNSHILVKNDSNKITLEANEPFYQDGDEILLSDGQSHDVFLITSVTHNYLQNTQRLTLNSTLKISDKNSLLGYQVLHDIYYLGKQANGKVGLYVVHINGRHELLMPFIDAWQISLIKIGNKRGILLQAKFYKKVVTFIFSQENENLSSK